MENLLFLISIVSPVFLLIIAGYILKKRAIIDDIFIDKTSSFVYKVCLPTLIFMKLYNVDLDKTFDFKMAVLIIAGTFLIFVFGWSISKLLKLHLKDAGAFIQGTFRSNYAIIGLAIISRMFSDSSVAKASFLLLFALPLYNVLSVIALTSFSGSKKQRMIKTVNEILLNPLILAVIIALPFSAFEIGLDEVITTTGNYLASIALPLALLGIGGTLELRKVIKASHLAVTASAIKIIFAPVFIIIVALLWNVHGEDLGILFVIFGCPTAIASFVLTAGLKGNVKLAGNIIVVSTLGSMISIISGLYFLKYFGFI